MFRFWKSITLLGSLIFYVVVNSATAQIESIVGTWEADSVSEAGFFRYDFLRLLEGGSYEHIILSDDPANIIIEERGSYTFSNNRLILSPSNGESTPITLDFSQEKSSLNGDQPTLLQFTRGREVDANEVYGNWQLFSDGQLGGEINLKSDGTYEFSSPFDELNQKGPFIIVGSTLLLYATVADNPELLGKPGIWFDLEVAGDELSYYLGNTTKITGQRHTPTLIRSVTWGALKSTIF